MTLRLKLPAITDATSLPSSPPEAHPLKRAGSITLIDPAYPSLAWDAGIPATVPNLAGGEAFGVSVSMPGGIVERTGRGAFHAAALKTSTGNESVTFNSPEARQKLLDAIAASHQIGIVEVYRITREAASTATQAVSYRWSGLITTGGTQDVATLRTSTASTVVGYQRARVLSEQGGTALISTGPQAAVSVLTGQGTAGTSTAMHLHHNGGSGSKQATRITYLALIEDLTVSGISPADFIDSVNDWQADVFGPGGRYAGDTWSAVPPHS